jgi:hypothetical protein
MPDQPHSTHSEPALCVTCNGERRIDLNAGWRGPPGVERHHWHPCPDCDGPAVVRSVPEPSRVVVDAALITNLREDGEYELAEIARRLLEEIGR